MGRVVVAIHQPNFFPWLGYFDKINRSDIFIFLDHVQFPKKGGVWTNRVKILINGKASWFTVPIDRSYHGFMSVGEIEIQKSDPWRNKLIKTLVLNYTKAPFFTEIMGFLEPLIVNSENNLCQYNINAVLAISHELGINGNKFILSSELKYIGTANEMLVSLVKNVNGNIYMCGGGASGYQEDEVFTDAGVELVYQDFTHSIYKQNIGSEFIQGLSIIDALMNCGFLGVKLLLAKDD